ncbi:MAG: glycosyltransferase [bacterium]
MVSGSVLILTAGFGEGHNAAARNLEAALRKDHPGLDVAVNDVFDESYGRLNRLLQAAYRSVINHHPALWGSFYNHLDRSRSATSGAAVFPRAAKLLADRITRYNADVVVSCFPGYGAFLDKVRSGTARPFTYVTVVTDSLTINSIWWRCSSDYFLVPNEPTAKSLERGGVPRDKIRVTGFPVPIVFSTPAPSRRTPLAGEPWRVLYMVNSGHDLAPGVVRELLAIENIALAVTCGRDTVLMDRLRQLALETGRPLELHGWTPEIPQLLRSAHVLISKAGGATVQEAMAARTPMVITQVIPGQEEGNALLLVENGAAVIATTPAAIADSVRSLFADNGELYSTRHAATAILSHPAGAHEAGHFIASFCLRHRETGLKIPPSPRPPHPL